MKTHKTKTNPDANASGQVRSKAHRRALRRGKVGTAEYRAEYNRVCVRAGFNPQYLS